MEEKELQNEKEHLESVLCKISKIIKTNNMTLNNLAMQLNDTNSHYKMMYDQLEYREKGDIAISIDQLDDFINEKLKDQNILQKQEKSPYFGKIIFDNGQEKDVVYIGISGILDNRESVVCDWRAPISSLFYDYGKGKASFKVGDMPIVGEILQKRQFKIEDKKMLFAFDSDVAIDDDILAYELGKNATEKMKNIVLSIQKEQNEIIRTNFGTIIINGVAGSGKTSIALHRVAYLLYKNKENLKSENILLVSPNRTFSSYISNVLPSLNEDEIECFSFYDFASRELAEFNIVASSQGELIENCLNFAKKCEKNSKNDKILQKNDDNEKNTNKLLNNIKQKNSMEYAKELKDFLFLYSRTMFDARKLVFNKKKVEANTLSDMFYNKYSHLKVYKRIGYMAEFLLEEYDVEDIADEIMPRLTTMLQDMFVKQNIFDIYNMFNNYYGYDIVEKNNVDYSDLSPLLYIKHFFLGTQSFSKVKHIIIDEMQDYSFLQFEIFDEMFTCNKTILGDVNQAFAKDGVASNLENLKTVTKSRQVYNLEKSYRSTKEITEYANSIVLANAKSVARSGESVKEIEFKNNNDLYDILRKLVEENKDKYNTICVICKTYIGAKDIYQNLKDISELELMDSSKNLSKISVMPSSLAKGLEFDMVVCVGFEKNETDDLSKNLKYIACTRALHKLCVIHNNKKAFEELKH